MNCKIIVYPLFERALKKLAKKYHSLGEDYRKLLADLQVNPVQGVDLGQGLRKVRMLIRSKGKGKSGGARVITLILDYSATDAKIGLLYIYDKSERESLSEKELLEEYIRFGGFPIIALGRYDEQSAYQIVNGIYHGVPVTAVLQAYSICQIQPNPGFSDDNNYLKNTFAEEAHLDLFRDLPEQKVITADGKDITELVETAVKWLKENSF